ncbi:MAG: ATP-binding protein [Thermoguttaceae bacterium]|jgi:serine/threonine-protein kinase RsbW|nr:ATP-binding protein [Thermoguttaceae bacterium]
MTDEKPIWHCKRVIPSRSGAGSCIEAEVIGELERQQWPARDVFCVRLALEEALVNAIKHGNHFDATKHVYVECVISPDLLRISIADEGEGFNPDDVPDPTDPEFIDRPSGRGIMLMRSFMSRVEFNERGNQVILEKRRAQPDQSAETPETNPPC